MSSLIALMIGLPLIGSIVNGLILRSPQPRKSGVVATLGALGSFLCAVTLYAELLKTETPLSLEWAWFSAGNLKLAWGFHFDWLTAVMALVVTGIGTVIHVYSIGYMADEKTPYRYFAYLNLFLFNMLVLISANSLPVLFVGWEGVGLCSYLLIGYWYQDLQKSNAGMKAFLVNRIGDAGFLLGIFLLFSLLGTLNFSQMKEVLFRSSSLDVRFLSLAAFFLFVGATGKSAQVPLYVWLPDAMAGPTPVSALIHAATMVTSGIYLIARMSFLFQVTPDTNLMIAILGAATALLAAFIATSQNDIKKVLAYSTVSQLGLMFLALGQGAYTAAIFHVFTHAFFKALLFLGAGSVIHAMNGEQDIYQMGGLKKELPKTFWTFTIGTIAICGIPPFAGFFSKDLLLFQVLNGPNGKVFWVLGSLASLLTAFYMCRLYALVFFGQYRGNHDTHPHESPSVMTVPLILLAVGSATVGFLSTPHGLHWIPDYFGHFLSHILPSPQETGSADLEMKAMLFATFLAVVGSGLGWWLFSVPERSKGLSNSLKPLITVFANKFWIDELYSLIVVRPFQRISSFLARTFDGSVIDTLVLSPGKLCRAGGMVLSFLQAGSAQFYLLVMLLGALVVFWMSLKGGVL